MERLGDLLAQSHNFFESPCRTTRDISVSMRNQGKWSQCSLVSPHSEAYCRLEGPVFSEAVGLDDQVG